MMTFEWGRAWAAEIHQFWQAQREVATKEGRNPDEVSFQIETYLPLPGANGLRIYGDVRVTRVNVDAASMEFVAIGSENKAHRMVTRMPVWAIASVADITSLVNSKIQVPQRKIIQ